MGDQLKILPISDLHLDPLSDWCPTPDQDAVLVIAGDLTEHQDVQDRLRMWGLLFRAIVFVPGNHEFYEADIDDRPWRSEGNVYVLDDNEVCIEGVWFAGGTLWTDMAQRDSLSMMQAEKLKDFRYIKHKDSDRSNLLSGPKMLTPYHTVYMHERTKELILDSDADVVVTHHAPSNKSVSERYRTEFNAAHATELFGMIADSNYKLWVHGHVHSSCDYMIENTRVICNPMGYSHDSNPDFNPELIIEV